MKVIHCGTEYECSVAVKCESDRYIKLYDENGAKIASFNHISDFADYEISGGSFVAPCDCTMPIELTTYVIGGRTIATDDWILNESQYCYEIQSNLISANATTCDVLIIFAQGTELEYTTKQEAGKIQLLASAAPLSNVTIESIHITRV